MPKDKGPRLYKRGRRYWGDFRCYANVGGREEALVAPTERLATTDRLVAVKLLADRTGDLEAARRGKALHGQWKQATLAAFAAAHLTAKAKSGHVTTSWLEAQEIFLRRAIAFLGADRDLESISVADMGEFVARLSAQKGQHGKPFSRGTIRHHLNAMSNLYRRAQAEQYVQPGFNPVAAMLEKPVAERKEANWLEIQEAAALLESARTLRTIPGHPGGFDASIAYPLVGTFLLTGARSAEVLGLEVEDISFDRKTVTFRPNSWRRLKTAGSARVLPLWPQLEGILRPHVFREGQPPPRLLFPNRKDGQEVMIRDFRRMLDRVATRSGWQKGEIRSRIFRHTYCAARLQTLDHGHPVSPYTVAKELGHGSLAMIERVYAHLGTSRSRGNVVAFHQAAESSEEVARTTP